MGPGRPHLTQKNSNYWQSGKPYLDAIQIRIFTDPQSMLSELEGGGIDVAILPLQGMQYNMTEFLMANNAWLAS
ncbi:MAG: hypothetical protein JOY61_14310 [Chloroflexi bacterium]|nr:hypothetical protein [Chloroflexota bacterium]